MELISDWHAHLDLVSNPLNYASDVNSAINSCLAVTTSPKAWMIAQQKFFPFKNINVALGLHPELAKSKANEILLFEKYSHITHFIGEIGLDGRAANWDYQIDVFSKLVDIMAFQKNKIISIHSRGADSVILENIQRLAINNIVILHWFSGTLTNLRKAINLHCYFSINPSMCKTKSGIEKIKGIPIELMLFESDVPFSTVSSTLVEPFNLIRICNNISQLVNVDKDKIIDAENQNTNKILSIVTSS